MGGACSKCGKDLAVAWTGRRRTIHGRDVIEIGDGEFYVTEWDSFLGMFDSRKCECEHCFNQPIRDREREGRREQERREEVERREQEQREEARRREQEQREEARRREQERLLMEARRREQEQQEEAWRREQERLLMEARRREQEQREEAWRREQERLLMEAWRREQEQQEEAWRREQERLLMEARRREQEQQEEVWRREQERLLMEARRREQEQQEEVWRREQERLLMEARRREQEQQEEAWRREQERLLMEAWRREQEKREEEESRREQERLLMEAWRREQEKREEEERRREQERLLMEAWRREQEKREEEERRREQERLLMEAWRREQEKREEEERRREQEKQEEEARRREQERLLMEAWRREQERLLMEARRREQERLLMEARRREQEKREEEARRREQEKREEEARRREQERLLMEARRREQEKREEEERRREQEKREEEARRREQEKREEEERRRGELAQRLQESQQRVEEQQEEQSRNISEDQESRRHHVHVTGRLRLAADDGGGERDELLDILSVKCSVPVLSLSLTQLTADQLGRILSGLGQVLFEDWTAAPPSLSTLQHAQVFITELCALSLDRQQDVSPQSASSLLQSLVGSISQAAGNVFENFLLTQALYLNLVHFVTGRGGSESDGVLVAKQWAKDELCAENLFVLDFLSTLTSSLQESVETASVFILKMEVECLKLLLFTLTHLNGKQTHCEPAELLLRLVQTNQWTPAEALTLLKALSQKYTEEASITQVLTLTHMQDLSPGWTDQSGRSLVQALDSAGFHQEFQETLRRKEEGALIAALAQLQMKEDDPLTELMVTVLQNSEKAPKDAPLVRDSLTCWTGIQRCLSQLCRAIFDTKGWRPTVTQMLRWCELVQSQRGGAPQLVGVQEDPCVTAMFAASQVCRGNKVDIVLNCDHHLEEQTKEWSDFYESLRISLTDLKRPGAAFRDLREPDVVFGTMEDFVFDYFQRGRGVMESPRGFIVEEQSPSWNVELSRLQGDDSLRFSAEVLQCLVGKFHSEDVKLRHKIIKSLFQALHSNIDHTHTESKVLAVWKRITETGLPSHEVFILNFVGDLLKVLPETGTRTPPADDILEVLFAGAAQSHTSMKELFQMVSNLTVQKLWSPVEALDLLGALTEQHHDKGCKKVLHLLEMYQVSSKWTDRNNQSVLELSRNKNLIQNLEKSLRDEETKSIEALFGELRQKKDIDEETLRKSFSVVTHVTNLMDSGKMRKHRDVRRARDLSRSYQTEDLQELLALLCNAVHEHKAGRKWWPRAPQMISWCLLALSDSGKLLEMGTGEGKSCVIAMLAALRVLRGDKVDVVSSSSVLCQRDAEEWTNFYNFFGITADTNTNKTKDEDRKDCYQKDVVYGTIDAFAADHLRQTFEMKDVRPDRRYECIIVDEVDSLLLDQGVQLTYLSSPMVSMQHLNTLLIMIWGHVSQYGFMSSEHHTFVHSPPASFCKAVFDSINTEGSEINDSLDILKLAEETNTVPKGFTENIGRSEKEELLQNLRSVNQDAVVHFFKELEDYLPYGFTVYTLDEKGLLRLRKHSPYNNQDVPELTFLVLEEGLCCSLYESEEVLIKPIAELMAAKIQYTPCSDREGKISIPGFLKNLVQEKLSVWVQNAFLALQLKQGQEYVVENDGVCPVDFRSTGIVELNKKWGDGLQQFVEIKHQVKLSTVSTVTNYVSNVSFFEKYGGKIYGTTGTLGSETDILFLQKLYPNLSACKIPTFNRKKLFEVKGSLKNSAEEWKSEIKRAVMDQIWPNSYRGGRAALVICETINKANEIHDELKGSIPGEIILYCRSDADSLSKIDKELSPGDVIVATNLAGRGTDIKVSKQVTNSGGLFVVLSFLSENTRVELQAFGRTARKGKPGSAQIIVSTEHLPFRTASSLEEAKSTRDRCAAEKINHTMNDVTELKLREDLFSEYLRTLQDIHKSTDGDEKRAVVAVMNEFWGIWLQIKSDDIDQLKRDELMKSLKADLSLAKRQCQSQTSPCSSIYHYIKFGNIALSERRWAVSTKLFEKAMKQDKSWAAIAFYSHAYCTIKQQNADYLTKAKEDLTKAQESLKYLNEEALVCLQLVKMSSAASANSDTTSLEKQFMAKCNMLSYFNENVSEAIKKLDEMEEKGKDAVAKKSPTFNLVSSADEDLQAEVDNLYDQGLKYVFSVEEEPSFPWGALAVFSLGVLQIVAGGCLIACSYGTFAQIGLELISEGISDCIHGIRSMVKGEFSWKSWAIEKAISLCVALVGFGVGKLIAKGFQGCKMSIQGFGKQLKLMPKFLSREVKTGVSVVLKTNMKTAFKYTSKAVVERVAAYGLGLAEEKILTAILNDIKDEVKQGVSKKVTSNMEKHPLSSLVDLIVLSHLEDEKQLQDLLKDEKGKRRLMAIFSDLSNAAVQPFYADLSWQHKLNSSLSSVIGRAKAESRGTARAILTIINTSHKATLAADAVIAMLNLSTEFFTNLHEQLKTFKEKSKVSVNVKVEELSASDTKMLKEFKQELAGSISVSLADALVEVFHQKFSSHIVSEVQGKVNGFISHQVRAGLKSQRTEEKLRAGQNNMYMACMSVDRTRRGEAGTRSQLHAEKIRNSSTPGTMLDAKVLSEETGTHVVILTEDSQGKRTKVQELRPSSKNTSETLTLIFRPKSAQYPDGHYDVVINNQTVSVVSTDKNCLFHAWARGMNPGASEDQIRMDAGRLRSLEADALLRQSGQWEPFVKRKDWTESIRGGDWYMLEAAGRKRIIKKVEENREVLNKEVGKVERYRELKKNTRKNPGTGQFLHADHQPAVSSILKARDLNQNSRLAAAMLEVGTNSSPLDPNQIQKVKDNHGLHFPTVYVPKEIHMEFPSTKSEAYRDLLATTISKDKPVDTLKLMVLGGMPRFQLDDTKNFKNFQDTPASRTRLDVYNQRFPQMSKDIVKEWSAPLLRKEVITPRDLQVFNDWMDNRGYMDQNDPLRNVVSRLL